MAFDELVRVRLEDGTTVTVGEAYAQMLEDEGAAEILSDHDATSNGRTIEAVLPIERIELDTDGPGENEPVSVGSMRGAELNQALEDAGLSTDGRLGEKQQRLATFVAEQGGVVVDGAPVV